MPESGSKHKYGVAGAGAVARSLIGRLPGKAREIGPVVAVSYSVASRIANALRAGQASRDASGLNRPPVVLFHAPPDQVAGLLSVLESPALEWSGKSVVMCDCEVEEAELAPLVARGATVAWADEFGIPGYLALRGAPSPALKAAHRIARELRFHAVEIPQGSESGFHAALTLSAGAFTPLLDQVADLLRRSGVRESDAPRIAATLFQKTAADYAHSGKQSWNWYLKNPDPDALTPQIQAAGPQLGALLRQLVLLGCDVFDKHGDVAEALRAPRPRTSGSRALR